MRFKRSRSREQYIGLGETSEPLNELRRHDGTIIAQWVGLGHVLSQCPTGEIEYWRNGLFATSWRYDPVPLVDRDELLKEIVSYIRHSDRLDEIPGARAAMPDCNPLWDMANAVDERFRSKATT